MLGDGNGSHVQFQSKDYIFNQNEHYETKDNATFFTRTVCVCVGGGDPANLVQHTFCKLAAFATVHITVRENANPKPFF